jgi:hypothetical protein
VLGLHLVAEEPYALVFDAHGTMLRIAKVQQLAPTQYTVLGWKVSNIRAAVAGLAQKGVGFERYPGVSQDGPGIWESPSGAKVAWFQDPMETRFHWPSSAREAPRRHGCGPSNASACQPPLES